MTIKNKLVLLSFFSNQNLYIPIKVLFFVKYMATYSEISAFKFFFVFAMLFLEIPSGLLSDKIGNKKIVVAGRTFLIFALLLIILSKNIMGFYVASTLLGISASLESGSLNSYQIGLGDKYNFNFSNLMVKIAKYNTIISVLFTITSSFLYAVSSELPFIITILLLLATWLMIVFGLPSYEKERRKKEEFFSKEDIRTLKAIFVKIIKHERLGIELFTSTVFIALLISIFEYYPLLFAKYSIPEVFFGSIFSCFILIGFLSISFFEKHEKNDRLYIVLLLLTAISFGLLASQSLILVIFAIFIQEFSFSFILTRISKVILDNIWDKRISSSYQSMVSFYDSIVRLTIPLILLVLMKWFSFSLTVIMISVMSFLIGVIYLMKIIKINWRK